MWSGELGKISAIKHHINLVPGARPFESAPYKYVPSKRELEEFEVTKQFPEGVIESSNSEWAAPVFFAPKNDGRLRFFIYYRKRINMTIKNWYPFPRMDECNDTLGDARIFTRLDALTGYSQVYIQNLLRVSRRSAPVHSHALRPHECTKNIWTWVGCHPLSAQVKHVPSKHRLYHHLLTILWGPYPTHGWNSHNPRWCRCNVEDEKV